MRVMIHEAKKAHVIAYMFMLPPVGILLHTYTQTSFPGPSHTQHFSVCSMLKEWVKVWYVSSQECDISVCLDKGKEGMQSLHTFHSQ